MNPTAQKNIGTVSRGGGERGSRVYVRKRLLTDDGEGEISGNIIPRTKKVNTESREKKNRRVLLEKTRKGIGLPSNERSGCRRGGKKETTEVSSSKRARPGLLRVSYL